MHACQNPSMLAGAWKQAYYLCVYSQPHPTIKNLYLTLSTHFKPCQLAVAPTDCIVSWFTESPAYCLAYSDYMYFKRRKKELYQRVGNHLQKS